MHPLVSVRTASHDDVGELLVLQRSAFVDEGQRYGRIDLPPLRDTVDDVRAAVLDPRTHVLVGESSHHDLARVGRLVAAARLHVPEGATRGELGRLVVATDLQGRGLGSSLLGAVHLLAAELGLVDVELFTGAGSSRNLDLYRRHGYVDQPGRRDDLGLALAVLRRPVTADVG
jgi:GNAT superfamily N-acetyltransferase